MAKAPSAIILDFETHAIQSRPVYPPEPVGVAIKWPKNRKSKYWAWGHPVGNNCSLEEGSRAVREVWASGLPVVFHNSKFDMDVAETHLGCPPLPWERIHDTMFLLFLTNPHLKQLGLKPASAVLLGMAPEERDAVKEWLVENRIIPRNASDSKVGENLSKAPGDLVGKYADGDVLRTLKLFQQFYPDICDRGMMKAYDRERQLVQILLRNEREGIRVDGPRLEKDLRELYRPAMIDVESYIRRRLKTKELNIDSNEELADALERSGLAEGFAVTKTGKRSVAKESLQAAIKDKNILLALGYRSRLATCVNMFMEPWLEIGKHNAGKLQTTWHQVRQGGGGGNFGARTGRLITSDPNLLNLSKDFEGRNDGYSHPTFTAKPLPTLPLVRKYMLPDKGQVWAHRDYNQQELRILGHFENGALMDAYLADPFLDIHDFVRLKIKEVLNVDALRAQTKTLNFGMIYGMGLGTLSERMGVDVDLAKKLRNAQLSALPGLKALEAEIKDLGKSDKCIVTWGGRQYFAEEPQIIDGRTRTFEYKLLNYSVQGSAADCTKESIIRYHNETRRDSRFLVTVYDEVNISSPKGALKREMALLRDIMEGVEFDVPMLSDGKTGPTWGDLAKYKEPAFDVNAWKARMEA